MSARSAVVFASDAAIFPVAAYQASRLAAIDPDGDVEVIIATEAAEEVERALKAGYRFRPLLIDPAAVAGLRPGTAQASPAAYYRVFLPGLLGDQYGRLLYLDTDVHICGPQAFQLLTLEMQGHAIAAVREAMPYRGKPAERAEIRRTIATAGDKYLNSGVLLIDTAEFRRRELERRILELAASRPLWLNDQSALNVLLDGDWLELSPAFNMISGIWNSRVAEIFPPAIVHFTGPRKPWHGPRFRRPHVAKAEMEAFFPTSPWPDFLSRFYGLKEAMEDMKNPPAPPAPSFIPTESTGYLKYLRETPFADVEAGITQVQLNRLRG
jgi:lipopolysaccharide biosynthesis glycosyltransferase